ncbi:MAG: lamin tail domain-containing protein, partial [Chitinophagaceae bacterium]
MKLLLLSCVFVLYNSVLLAQNRYDILIDEIMADPSPQVGFPNNEWIELVNTSSMAVNLRGWRIGDNSGQSGPMPDFILAPDSFVIVCTGSAVAALSAFGNTISVTSFPSLDNDGEVIFLKSSSDQVIHAVNYSASWYLNELKKEGGWTLEMIDIQNPCTGNGNWKASNDPRGGTPGMKNSVEALNSDLSDPQLINAYTTNSTTIVLVFDEPLDSLSAASVSNYKIDQGYSYISTVPIPNLFNLIQLQTNNPLLPNTIYNISVSNLKDCNGNEIGLANKTRTGVPEDAQAGDVIINEILFNPRPNANDYIEFYNKSNKIFDAAKLYIANRNSSGAASSITPLSSTAFYIFPGDYIGITKDLNNLSLNYLVKNPEVILTINSLPSFPDDNGFVLLLNQQGDIADEVNYSADWHFKLIDNAEGVSLERIDPDGPSQNALNWHSAASTAGYGTPGYKNSQFKNLQSIISFIEVTPKVFSPDNDGYNDIATIQYKIDQPGYVANVTIFDAAGRPVRNLVRNGILSTAGYWNWDGLDDKGLK